MRMFALTCFVALSASQAWSQVWEQSGYEGFSKGTFGDAGANIYVSHRGRIQLINRLDLNNDGKIDVVIANGHGHTEKEDVFIYPNRGGDFDQRFRIPIAADGAEAVAVADLNRDGKSDLVIANRDNGITTRLDAFIYYGSANGFSAQNRTELLAFEARAVVAADFNHDGWIDLAFACRNKGREGMVSTIYWNSPSGFSPQRKQDFSSEPLERLVAIDWDGDGRKDLLAVTNDAVLLYRYNAGALQLQQKVPGGGKDLVVADFDRDGHSDYAVVEAKRIRVYLRQETKTAPVIISGFTNASA